MLMICFDLDKPELPDLAIMGIPTCPIWLFHDFFDYFWPKKVKNISFKWIFWLFLTPKGHKHQSFKWIQIIINHFRSENCTPKLAVHCKYRQTSNTNPKDAQIQAVSLMWTIGRLLAIILTITIITKMPDHPTLILLLWELPVVSSTYTKI